MTITSKINNQKSISIPDRCYKFSVDLVKFVGDLPEKGVFKIIGNQVLRSGTSIGANVIEAQAGSSRKDFVKFYYYALKSANESAYWLQLLKDSTSVKEENLDMLISEADQLAKMIGRSIITLKSRKD